MLVELAMRGNIPEPKELELSLYLKVFEMPRYPDIPHYAWVDLGDLIREAEQHVSMPSKSCGSSRIQYHRLLAPHKYILLRHGGMDCPYTHSLP